MSNELGRRAVACKGWRWMPGMLCKWESIRVEEGGQVGGDLYIIGHGSNGLVDRRAVNGDLPDLTDPATLGCLLHLVREAWGDSGAHVWLDRRTGIWQWMAGGCLHSVWVPSAEDGYDSEAGALVAALEAAP